MKKIPPISIALLALLLFTSSLGAQPNDWDIERLTGSVKRIDEDRAKLVEKNGIKKETDRRRYRTIIFDKKGRKTYEWMGVSGLDPIEHFYSYKKDKRYRRTVRQGMYSGTGRSSESTSMSRFVYNSEENVLYEEVFIGAHPDYDVLTQKYKFLFNSSNNLIESILYSANGDPTVQKKFIFGDDRLPTEMLIGPVSEEARKQSIKYIYEVDATGNWIKLTSINTLANKDSTTQIEITYRKITYYK